MPSRSSASYRKALVAELERTGALRSSSVRKAFLAVPRELFVPAVAESAGLAKVYANEVHIIQKDARGMATSSSSMPGIMAEMLEHLDVRPGHRVLEIGTGTGYNAALLATLVGQTGSVTSIELQSDLAERAAVALRDGGYDVRVLVADARLALYGEAPFDRIILTASTPSIARGWFDQLAPGGLLELPFRVGGVGPWEQVVLTLRKEHDVLRSVAVVMGGFMPLRGPGEPGDPPPPMVQVGDYVEGERPLYADLAGPELSALSLTARRSLVGLLLQSPRVRTVNVPKPASRSLMAYVAFAPSPSGTVGVRHYREEFRARGWLGVGLAAKNGRSFATVVGGREGRARIESYGDGAAAVALHGLVDQWRAAGRPTAHELSFTVGFGEPPAAAAAAGSEASGAAKVFRRGDCWVQAGWPHILR